MASQPAHAPAGHGHAEHKHHVCSIALFTKVFLALIVLTAITVWSSRMDFGSLNMPIAMLIASIKATLVMTFFMHLKYDTAMNQITMISSFLFLALLFLFTLGDLTTRAKTDHLNTQVAPMSMDFKERGYESWLIHAVRGTGHVKNEHGGSTPVHTPEPPATKPAETKGTTTK